VRSLLILNPSLDAYLDIETTGLSPRYCEVTVVGIHLVSGHESRFIQLVGDDVTADKILWALDGVGTLYTYNGSRFDLPFIYVRLGINLAKLFSHCDLMYHCWRNNLYGGFKVVERRLGIQRKLKEVDGLEAVRLWWKYVNDYDEVALATLLEYNKEDVMNLKTLRERLL
jgi:uncharacterized protein YprB with RNaseH-like and TPR domain